MMNLWLLGPRVEDWDSGTDYIGGVAGNKCQVMVLGCSRKQPVDHRQIVLHRGLRLCSQNSPAFGNALVNGEDSVCEAYG